MRKQFVTLCPDRRQSRSCLSRLVLWLRWQAARPIIEPILKDMDEYQTNLRACAKMKNVDDLTWYANVEKADSISAYGTQIEDGFGRIEWITAQEFHSQNAESSRPAAATKYSNKPKI